MSNLLEMLFEKLSGSKTPDTFAVVMTDEGDAKLYIKKFKRLLKEYPFLIQNPNDRLSLSSLEYGSIVLFGNNSSFDYTILQGNNELMKLRKNRTILYNVVSDEVAIANALERYVEKNSVICPCLRWKKAVKPEADVTVTISIEEVPTPKKVATFDVVDIYDAFVKIGWNIYYTTTDTWTGKQYVNVDGTVFQIKTNRFGQKYLG
jgi:hypothetical protein